MTLAYVASCGGDLQEWRARWYGLADELTPEDPADEAAAPYLGLAAFRQRDAERFHGRERLVERVRTMVSERRFVAVLGASGSGKSSLLRAGLLPALAGRPSLVLTPGAHPLREYATGLGAMLGVAPGGLLGDLTERPAGLGLLTRQVVAKEGSERDFVLVADQFEEVFTLCQDAAERAAFIAALVAAAGDPGNRTRVVIGVRTDFYHHCAQHPDLAEVLQDAQVLVGPMTAEELHQAITQPAVDLGYRVETALVSRLVADATGQAGVLPLLSHTLLETWRRRRGNTVSLTGYEATGGIERAVAQSSEAVYNALGADGQALVRQIFLRLTALGEGTEDTRRRISRGELDHPRAAEVLEALARARLITLHGDAVEIAHEALIRSWPRLRGWLAEDRDGLRVHRQITEAAEAWEEEARDHAALHRGTRLAVALEWAAAHRPLLSPRERDFLAASATAAAEDQAAARRRARGLRRLTALLAVLVMLTTATTIYAVRSEQAATRQRDLALSQKVAGEADRLRQTDPALSAQLSLAAYRLSPTEDARNSLLRVFATPYATRLTGHSDRVNSVAVSPDGHTLISASRDRTAQLWDITRPHRPRRLAVLTGHRGNVNAAAFSPDGRLAATASWDHTVRLWNLSDPGRPPAVLPHDANVNAVAFSPDGRLLATAGDDRIARVWDVAGLRVAASLRGHSAAVVSVAFSPDGRTLATGGFDQTARLWDLADPDRPVSLRGHTGPVAWVAYRPDGHLLATAGNDGDVRLWQVDGTRARARARVGEHEDIVRSVAFSADGRTLVSAGHDDAVRLTDVADPDRPRALTTFTGHTGNAVSAVFAPGGRTLASASDDYTVRLWDLPYPALTGHTGGVYWLAFSPDGRTLATVGEDRALHLWDVAEPGRTRQRAVLTGHDAAVWGVTFSPDGATAATAAYDRTVRLWDVAAARPGPLATLTGHTANVNAAAFSPDGTTLASGSLDTTVRFTDVRDPRRPRHSGGFTADAEGVNTLAFSPDGRTLATAGWDHDARLWNVTDLSRPIPLSTLTGHADGINSLAYSPDGRTLATASFDRTARLWDVTDPAHAHALATLNGHTGSVSMVAFSPDGRRLATTGNDRSLRLWDLADRRRPVEMASLSAHADGVSSVAFGPDGHTVATGSHDRTALVWETATVRLAARLCEAAFPRITEAEWATHFPGLPYRPPCETRAGFVGLAE
ncbi:nSTAND1 domain-containing NTPase [Nonomuraea endophytica]|uniref:WD40 repeat domain-containing protein n=1 Tax=Nonomuraea endophytica TaxID=714136 RepID=UPI0037C66D51